MQPAGTGLARNADRAAAVRRHDRTVGKAAKALNCTVRCVCQDSAISGAGCVLLKQWAAPKESAGTGVGNDPDPGISGRQCRVGDRLLLEPCWGDDHIAETEGNLFAHQRLDSLRLPGKETILLVLSLHGHFAQGACKVPSRVAADGAVYVSAGVCHER